MKATLKQLMLDFIHEPFPQPFPRDIEIPKLPATVKKAIVLIGMRRAGKTWVLYQEMRRLMQSGLVKEQLIYLNFEDDRLANFTTQDWADFLPAYIETFPKFQTNECVFFLDEIHVAPSWEKFVLRLIEQEKTQVYLSGSSAKMLSKEISTNLRGRTLTREIFPMSFKEVLKAKGLSTQKLTTHARARLQSLLQDYMEQGGFPETLEVSHTLRIELIQNYIETVVYRDVVERHQIKNIIAVRQFIIQAIKNSASLLSINKMYNAFKSLGISVSKNALYEYAQYFQDAYALFFVPAFQFSMREQQNTPMKVYPVDPGVITAYTIKPSHELASRFETTVFLQLRRKTENIFYYHTPSGKEVDFVAQSPTGALALYQACFSMSDPKTLAREVSALEEAMEVLEVNEGTIVTLEQTQTITVKSGVVHCIGLLEWLI